MKRSIFLILLALCFLLIFSASASSEEFVLNYANTGISDYAGPGGVVSVPGEIGGYPMYTLAMGTFKDADGVTELTIASPIHTLDSGAIDFLRTLTSVQLPDSLQIINSFNFRECDSLESVTVPAAVRFVGKSCFAFCDMLQSVTFLGDVPYFDGQCFEKLPDSFVCYVPDDLLDAYREVLPESISIQSSGNPSQKMDFIAPESAFDFDPATGTLLKYNEHAPVIEIPQTIGSVQVQTIGEDCFANLGRISYVIIPDGVERIADGAFAQDSRLVYVSCPDSLTEIGNRAFSGAFKGSYFRWSNGLKAIGDEAFSYCSFGNSGFVLPEGLESIGKEAFRCIDAAPVSLPSTLQHLGERAFADSGIPSVYLGAHSMIDIAPDAFTNTFSLKSFLVSSDCPMDVYEGYRDLLASHEGLRVSFKDPEGAEFITGKYQYTLGDDQLYYLQSYGGTQENLMTHYFINGGASGSVPVAGLGDGVFKGSQTIKNFWVTRSLTFKKIGNEAFADSTLEHIDLFQTVEEIGDGAFRNCTNLTEITLPASLRSIGEGAFDGCDHLEKVHVQCDVSLISPDTFSQCALLQEYPYGVRLPENASSEDVASLSSTMGVAPEKPLRREGEPDPEPDPIAMPFEATDPSLFRVDRETGALIGYTGKLADVVVPREIDGVTVKSISRKAFSSCLDYTNTGVVTNVTSWTHLRSVVLPETVTHIEDGAFKYCQQLETFVCYGPLESTGRSTFSWCTSLKDAIFVNGVGAVDHYAFELTSSLRTFYTPNTLSSIGMNAFSHSGIEQLRVDAVSLGDGAFLSCEQLRELHFTKAVQQLGNGVASQCSALSLLCLENTDLSFLPSGGFLMQAAPELTVRIPAAADAQAEKIASRVLLWGSKSTATVVREDCTLEPVLPDIDAILAEYKANPYIQPTPEPTPGPQPVGNAGLPYLGTWKSSTVTLGGTTSNAADMGMALTLILNEDGTCLAAYDGKVSSAGTTPWSVTSEGAVIDGHVFTLAEDGTLSANIGGMILTLVRPDNSSLPVVSSPGEAGAPYIGTWQVATVTMGDTTYNASDLGLSVTMTINPDGTCASTDPQTGKETPGVWSLTEDGAIIDGQPVSLQEDGSLLAEGDGMSMTLVRADSTQPAAPAAPEGENTAYVGTWQVATVTMGDTTYNAADLGLSVTMTINPDGTCSSTDPETGEETPGVWSLTENGAIIDGQPVTLQEDGSLLAEGDGMSMTLVRADSTQPAAPAAPGEEAAVYFGTWKATEIRIGDNTYPAADFGLDVSMTLSEDGTYTLASTSEKPQTGRWTVNNTGVSLGILQLTPQEDGTLFTTIEDMGLVFTHEASATPEPEPAPTQEPEPEPIPTQEPEPVPAPAENAGEPYIGTWQVATVTMGDTTYHAADLGLSVTMTINPDGTCASTDPETGEETPGVWSLTEDGAIIDGQPVSLQEDGSLLAEGDGMSMTLVRADGTQPDAPAAPGEEAAVYFGAWKATEIRIGDNTYPAADFGLDASITLSEDGTYTLASASEKPQTGRWTANDTGVSLGILQLTLQEDGTLFTALEDMGLVFTHEGASLPEPVPTQEPEPEPTPTQEPEPEPVPSQEPEPVPAPVENASEPYIGTWQVATITMGGSTYHAADLGLSVTMIINPDGTCVSTDPETGEETPGVWSLTEDGAIIDGQPVSLQEDGSLLTEGDGMSMTLVRADGTKPDAPAVPGEEAAVYFGTWKATEIRIGDNTYPAADFGLDVSMMLAEDGSYTLSSASEAPQTGRWTVNETGVSLGILQLTLQEDGTLFTALEDMGLVFTHEGASQPVPEPVPTQEPEPEPVPTQEPEPEPMPTREPRPTGIPIGSPLDYVGTWRAVTVQLGDQSYSAESFGYECTLILREDGTYELTYPDSEPLSGSWTLDADGIHASDYDFIPQEDQTLCASQPGTSIYFALQEPEPEPTVDLSAFAGEWTAVYVSSGIFKGNPRELWHLEITLTLRQDGTGELDYAGSDGGRQWWWDPETECAYYGDAAEASPIQIDENGFLHYGSETTGIMIFSKDPDAVWNPGGTVITMTTQPSQTPEPAVPSGSSKYLEKKYIAVSANVGGFVMDASRLGGEYSVTFHADGTATFVMTGQEAPGLKWTMSGDDFVIDYFGAGEMRFTPDADGLKLNFFDSMIITMVPES